MVVLADGLTVAVPPFVRVAGMIAKSDKRGWPFWLRVQREIAGKS